MKLRCSTALLSSALSVVTRVIKSKISMPILSTVMIRADAETKRVTVCATNLDAQITTSFAAAVEESGGICIEGRRFAGIVSALFGLEATLESSSRFRLKLRCGPSTFNLLGIDAAEFPMFREIEGQPSKMKFKQSELARHLGTVERAQSDDETRFVLNGVHISNNGSLDFVATDGRRIHVRRESAAAPGAGDASVIVPASVVDAIGSLLDPDGDADAVLTFYPEKIRVQIAREAGEIELISKLVAGRFPDWEKIMSPFANKDYAEITVSREEMLGALSRARLALDEKYSAVVLTVEGASITINASSPNSGEATEVVVCKNPKLLAGSVAMNNRFLIDGLESAQGDEVTILLHPKLTDTSPVGLSQGDEIRIVIMPVRRS